MPTLEYGDSVGAALRAVREHKGLTLEQVGEITRVRSGYLGAIEAMRIEALPSRPFALGYVRAYAKALGLDHEAAVNRFRLESPDPDASLHAPVGVQKERDPRVAAFVAVGLLVFAAFVAWNVARRIMAEKAPPTSTVAQAPQAAVAGPPQSVTLGAPLPAPAEATTPDPYITPGLAAAAAADGSADAVAAAAKLEAEALKAAPPPSPVALGAPFKPAGQIMGADADASTITIQARKSASLVVRAGDGQVYFARQMAKGEAYRAPRLGGLVADLSDPAAFEIFVGGASRGLAPAVQTSLSKFTAAAP